MLFLFISIICLTVTERCLNPLIGNMPSQLPYISILKLDSAIDLHDQYLCPAHFHRHTGNYNDGICWDAKHLFYIHLLHRPPTKYVINMKDNFLSAMLQTIFMCLIKASTFTVAIKTRKYISKWNSLSVRLS